LVDMVTTIVTRMASGHFPRNGLDHVHQVHQVHHRAAEAATGTPEPKPRLSAVFAGQTNSEAQARTFSEPGTP
jgi:hypothetical protein